jgi:hypothetical protein
MDLQSLPDEIIIEIINWLNDYDKINLLMVSKIFYSKFSNVSITTCINVGL